MVDDEIYGIPMEYLGNLYGINKPWQDFPAGASERQITPKPSK